MELLSCGKQKAIKHLAELDMEKGIGLIEKKRMGLGRPNVIYVKNFMLKLQDEDSTEQQSVENPQKYENRTSVSLKIIPQEVLKSDANKTEKNKTDNNQSYRSNHSYLQRQSDMKSRLSSREGNDLMEQMERYRSKIKENIEYEGICARNIYQKDVLDELVELIVEVLMKPDESLMRIAGDDKSVSIVKDRFLKLGQAHIEYVLECLKKNTTKIGNIKSYLLTVLYNSPLTIDSYYQAEVKYDMQQESQGP